MMICPRAQARNHRRIAKNDWRAGETIEESNSGAKKNCLDVDVDFVEEPSVQALLDSVGAVDPSGLPGGGSFGLVHGAFDAVGHEKETLESIDRKIFVKRAAYQPVRCTLC